MSFALAAIIFVISLLAVIAIAWTIRLLLVEGTPTPPEAFKRWLELAKKVWDSLQGRSQVDDPAESAEPTDAATLAVTDGSDQPGDAPVTATAQQLAGGLRGRIKDLALRALDAPAFAHETTATP